MKIFEFYRRQNPGASLIMATIFATFFMYASVGFAEAQMRIWQSLGDRESSAKARYLAESAQELAGLWRHDKGRGANSGDIEAFMAPVIEAVESDLGIECSDVNPSEAEDQPCIGFKVVGRSEESAQIRFPALNPDYYTIPAAYVENGQKRGTGSAAAKCSTPQDNAGFIDDPCNWNVLKYGEDVEIPLYYEEDTNGNGIIEAGEIEKLDVRDADDFILRVRTRCKDVNGVAVENCEYRDRIELYPPVVSDLNPDAGNKPFRHPDFEKDPVLVQWMINDMQGGGTLIAGDVTANGMRPKMQLPLGADKEKDNTEISGGRINAANDRFGRFALRDFIMLKGDYKGERVADNQPSSIQNFIAASQEPKLRLSFVTRALRLLVNENENMDGLSNAQLNNSERYVPELEYQVLTKFEPVADSKAYIIGWSRIGAPGADYGRTMRKSIEYPASLGGFALGNL